MSAGYPIYAYIGHWAPLVFRQLESGHIAPQSILSYQWDRYTSAEGPRHRTVG